MQLTLNERSSACTSYVQLCGTIARSDVSVYQIFRRFRFRKPEFPGRWIAKPLSHLPIPLPFLFFLTLFFFPSISYVFLPASIKFFFFPYSSRFRIYAFLFLPAASSEIGQLLPILRRTKERKRGAAFLCFFYFVFGPVETFVSGVASTFFFFFSLTPSVDLFPRLLRIVAKLIRLASLSRPLDHRRATL